MQIISFKEPGSWKAQITLSNIIYVLEFKWNALNEYWSMNIYDENEEPIIFGIKVVVNWNLTEQFVSARMPPGDIVCQNILGEWNKIIRFDMGEIAELFYYEEGEIETLIKAMQI